jgi:hypothetical protein
MPPSAQIGLFHALGLNPDASLPEVKQAYKDLVQVWHPDRFTHDPALQERAQKRLQEINEAFQILETEFCNGTIVNEKPRAEPIFSGWYQANETGEELTRLAQNESSPPREAPIPIPGLNPMAWLAFGVVVILLVFASVLGVLLTLMDR